MTRWLEAAQRAFGAGNLPKKPKQPPMPEVNSVNSVNSDARKAITPDELAFHEARVAALADPDGIARTPEAIDAVWDHAAAMAREGAPPSCQIARPEPAAEADFSRRQN